MFVILIIEYTALYSVVYFFIAEIKSKNVDQPNPESETNVADAETRLDSELSVDKGE